LLGRPDFIFRRARLAVFVDGCFWHGCRWHCRMPHSRTHYWGPKIAANAARDLATNRTLRSHGWRVLRIWEHSLKHPQRVCARLNAVLASCSGTA
jgi:DNA mismatch endonuclease (patch repair protein)